MNYEEMTDFEINKAVAELEGLLTDNGYGFIDTGGNVVCNCIMYNDHGSRTTQEIRVDYCNNPSDAWPIIIENKIGLDYDGKGRWYAGNAGCNLVVSDENALRSCMIAYLRMNEDNGEGK